ncbi:hypothetical protein DFH09DRAFT_1086960 [Mycena vulgaris]|nr:hypothetical protein DFH09DRAFT_1086960 [Mycena vulgaris]
MLSGCSSAAAVLNHPSLLGSRFCDNGSSRSQCFPELQAIFASLRVHSFRNSSQATPISDVSAQGRRRGGRSFDQVSLEFYGFSAEWLELFIVDATISGIASEILGNMLPVHSSRALMSTDYLLLVQTIDGIRWKPGPTHRKNPNLYIAIHCDGVEAGRTQAIRKLEPKWGHSLEISASPSVLVSLRLFHHSTVFLVQDKFLAAVDIDIAKLRKLCDSDGDSRVVPLELIGVKGELAGKPAGTISVRLTEKLRPAHFAIEQAQKKTETAGLGRTHSALLNAGDGVEQTVSATSDLASAL